MAREKTAKEIQEQIDKLKIKEQQLLNQKQGIVQVIKTDLRKAKNQRKILLGSLFTDMDYYEVKAMKENWKSLCEVMEKNNPNYKQEQIEKHVGDFKDKNWDRNAKKIAKLESKISE